TSRVAGSRCSARPNSRPTYPIASPTAVGGDVHTTESPACDSDVIQPRPSPEAKDRPHSVPNAPPATAAPRRRAACQSGQGGPPTARRHHAERRGAPGRRLHGARAPPAHPPADRPPPPP